MLVLYISEQDILILKLSNQKEKKAQGLLHSRKQ